MTLGDSNDVASMWTPRMALAVCETQQHHHNMKMRRRLWAHLPHHDTTYVHEAWRLASCGGPTLALAHRPGLRLMQTTRTCSRIKPAVTRSDVNGGACQLLPPTNAAATAYQISISFSCPRLSGLYTSTTPCVPF